MRLRHNSLPGRFYDLQVSDNLKDWISLGSSQAGDYSLEFTDSSVPTGQRFYRVRPMRDPFDGL